MEVKYCDVCGMIIKNEVNKKNGNYLDKEKKDYTSATMASMFMFSAPKEQPKTIEEAIEQQIENMPYDLCNECKKYIYENYIGWLSDRRTATHTLLKEK